MPLPPLHVALLDATRRDYAIHFDDLTQVPDRLAEVGLRTGNGLVVTDENVAAYYLAPLRTALEDAGWTPHVFVLPPSEATKSAEHLATLYDWALGIGIDRQTPVLVLGGGVVGDLAGFAAATLLRGLPLVQLPTSLVAQVDSAIGGKTGINHATGKNLIGAFHQPRLVLADSATLSTLPEREWTSGLAEVVKAALIADVAFLGWLESNWNDIIAREPEVVAPLVRRAAGIKAAIVAEDEREAGRRALLNFGHTFGHAIERVAGYGTFTHGEAVALGMRAALHLSHALHPDVSFQRADALVAQLPVPDGLADLRTADLMQAVRTDKKRRGDQIRYVVLREPGAAYVTADVPSGAVEAAWEHAKNEQDSTESLRLPR